MGQIQFEGDTAKMLVLATLASKGTSLVVRAFVLVASELGYTLTPADLEPILEDLERERGEGVSKKVAPHVRCFHFFGGDVGTYSGCAVMRL